MKDMEIQVLFSEFDQMFGPIPICSFPQIDENVGIEISNKSMHFLTEKESFNLSSITIIPFPSEGKKGIAINIDWRDNARRGGMGIGAFTLLFNQENDTIFYKYIRDFEPIFEEIVEELVKLKSSNTTIDSEEVEKSEIEKLLKAFHQKFSKLLNSLKKQELGIKDEKKAFPEEAADITNYIFKVIVCGDPGCGKTSIVLRYTDMAFRRTYIPTIGVNMSKKEVILNNIKNTLVLWDLAGQTKFKLMRKQFYDGANAVLFVYDLTRSETLENIKGWYNDINNHIEDLKSLPIYLCGNKSDLTNERQVNEKQARDIATYLNMGYIETSALTGENVEKAFIDIMKRLTSFSK